VRRPAFPLPAGERVRSGAADFRVRDVSIGRGLRGNQPVARRGTYNGTPQKLIREEIKKVRTMTNAPESQVKNYVASSAKY